MAGLAQINIRFAANLKEFSTQMQSMQRDFARVGKQMQDVGAAMTMALTAPLMGIGALSMKAAADLEQLKTSLNTVFKGDTNLSTQAFETIQKFAKETPYGLEEVTQSFIKLKNLGLNASEESLRSYGNTASAMGKSLDQMIEAVADASVGEFERLKEFGIKSKTEGDKVLFTFQGVTTTVGKNADEITAYLKQIGDVNFAGGMEAQSNTFNGQLAKLKDAVQITMAQFGQILNDIAGPWIAKIAEWVESFQTLDPAMQKIIVVVAGLLAAAGPLIALFGTFAAVLPSIISGVSAMGAAFTALTGPIGWTIAAIGVIIGLMIKNWSSVKKALIDTANYFIDLYNESIIFRGAIEHIIGVFKTLWQTVRLIFNAFGSLFKALGNDIKNIGSTIGALFKAIITGDLKAIPEIFKNTMNTTVGNVAGALNDLTDDFSEFSFNVKKIAKDAVGNTMTKRHRLLVDTSETKEQIKTDVETAIVDGVNDGVDKANASGKKLEIIDLGVTGSEKWIQAQISEMEETASKLDVTTDAYRNLVAQAEMYRKTLDLIKNPIVENVEPEQNTVGWYNYNIDALKKMRDDANITLEEYKRLSNEINILETTFKLQVEGADTTIETLNYLKVVADEVKDALASSFSAMTDSMVESLGEANNGLQRFMQVMFKTVTKIIAMALAAGIAHAIEAGSLSALGTGVAAAFTTPAFIATAVGGVVAAFAAIPKFANGGIVSGPTLGLMGEYAGAANNPEVIAPLSKLKELIQPSGMGDIHIELGADLVLRGEDLKLVLDRVEKRQFRTG